MPENREVTVSSLREIMKEIDCLMPGQVCKIGNSDGRDYAVLEWDDFEMLCEKSGLRLKAHGDG